MFCQAVDASLRHIAVLGNALPRRCGLATYTSHSTKALRTTFPDLTVDHYAMDDGHGVSYGPDVAETISADDETAYVRIAATIRRSGAQLLWLHHEFGIFGGAAGDHILTLIDHVRIPVVVTLHTVLANPNEDQRRVMRALITKSDRVIVMAQEASRLLQTVYQARPDRIEIIAHGAPDRPLAPTYDFRMKLKLGGGPLILTFGLLSPGKGIETAIRALPQVVERHPHLQYLVVGATHPALVREQGEVYRDRLKHLAVELGVDRHVGFIDQFLEDDALLDYLQAADIYLTPYLGKEQVTSGTLSYALAMGRPVVSTPYVHAQEALADNIGTLVPFDDADAIAAALNHHLDDPAWLASKSRMIWTEARSTIWPENASRVMAAFHSVRSNEPIALPRRSAEPAARQVLLSGIAAMTDDVGIIQHSVHGVPDRRHGYCIDDNARALKLVSETRAGDPVERNRLSSIFAAFMEHAWNDQNWHFRNFMAYDRSWLETQGSEDSNGRALWALGHVMRTAPHENMRRWANGLFNKALPLSEMMLSPRAIAFSMLAMIAVLDVEPGHVACRERLVASAAALEDLFVRARKSDWCWFEAVLSYDNARLSQAMIEAGLALNSTTTLECGLTTLRWLMTVQTAPESHFRPVGSESFHIVYQAPCKFDQQPLEAAATIDACSAAFRATGDRRWIDEADKAFRWFYGDNDLNTPLASADGSLCYDGLTRTGVNLNMGAESILALQMARHSISELFGEEDVLPQLTLVQ